MCTVILPWDAGYVEGAIDLGLVSGTLQSDVGAAIADAASFRTCDYALAASPLKSPKRSLRAGFEGLIQPHFRNMAFGHERCGHYHPSQLLGH